MRSGSSCSAVNITLWYFCQHSLCEKIYHSDHVCLFACFISLNMSQHCCTYMKSGVYRTSGGKGAHQLPDVVIVSITDQDMLVLTFIFTSCVSVMGTSVCVCVRERVCVGGWVCVCVCVLSVSVCWWLIFMLICDSFINLLKALLSFTSLLFLVLISCFLLISRWSHVYVRWCWTYPPVRSSEFLSNTNT